MALWDIVTLVVLGLGLLYGIWKGFLRILLKIGALILSVILARPLGNFISDTFVAGFFEGNRLEALLTFGASLLVTVVVFIILYILPFYKTFFNTDLSKTKTAINTIPKTSSTESIFATTRRDNINNIK